MCAKRYVTLRDITGPLPKTTVDFWRMVWQERSQTIVMLANVVEGGYVKCHKYWPEAGTQYFGPFNVTITGQQILADYIHHSGILCTGIYIYSTHNLEGGHPYHLYLTTAD